MNINELLFITSINEANMLRSAIKAQIVTYC